MKAKLHRLESSATAVGVRRVTAALTCQVIHERLSTYSAVDEKYTCVGTFYRCVIRHSSLVKIVSGAI
jgi:hypothetical protein